LEVALYAAARNSLLVFAALFLGPESAFREARMVSALESFARCSASAELYARQVAKESGVGPLA
jgi:hypothetical protein